MNTKIDPQDENLLHDMKTCLLIGETPTKPLYWGKQKARADQIDEEGPETTKLANLFGVATNNRAINTTWEKTVGRIMTFLDICLDFGYNPLTALRKAFPEFKWAFYKWPAEEPALPEEIAKANYLWYLGGDIFTASKEKVPHHFCCSYQEMAEMPPEVQKAFKFHQVR